MIINSANLAALRTGYSTAMQKGQQSAAKPQADKVATRVKASQKEQKYGWLGKMPDVREWIGDRVVQNIAEHDYAIKEKKFELTLGVDRDDIDTDNLGHYALLFEQMGESTVTKPGRLIWDLLSAGFATECYDGQNFFDTDHPVLDKDGEEQSVSNTGGGAGTPCGVDLWARRCGGAGGGIARAWPPAAAAHDYMFDWVTPKFRVNFRPSQILK